MELKVFLQCCCCFCQCGRYGIDLYFGSQFRGKFIVFIFFQSYDEKDFSRISVVVVLVVLCIGILLTAVVR
jgi:hypothetical protein